MLKEAMACRIKNGMKHYTLGDKPPFTTMSKASMARVMEAVIRTDAKIHNTFSLDVDYPRAWVTYLIELPIGMEEEFERISLGKLSEPQTVTTS